MTSIASMWFPKWASNFRLGEVSYEVFRDRVSDIENLTAVEIKALLIEGRMGVDYWLSQYGDCCSWPVCYKYDLIWYPMIWEEFRENRSLSFTKIKRQDALSDM